MHPAYSVIFFTTLTGFGYGLIVMYGFALIDPTTLAGKIGYVIALATIGGGLLSSTLHLGHPERAVLAFSQWRSSWLSREGVAAVIGFIPMGLAAFGAIILGENWHILAVVASLLSITTVYCTSMIYAQLKTVHHWATPLTCVTYALFSLTGGYLGAVAIGSFSGHSVKGDAGLALAILVFTWVIKGFWWRRADTDRAPASIETATGLGRFGPVRLLDKPHMTDNYLNREMGYVVARKHALALRRITWILGLGAPAVLLVASYAVSGIAAALILTLAVLSYLAGTFVERWLFFAEARHTVSLYYGQSLENGLEQ
ncbi:dimethyl sulfoxide reductase anchor subunit family protein [Coralliovum pocilloporae]|uniref:dimethyl sulfoxide reductase anchor subunit family protein n=1 Tax=Coralliovum pocilloporae TaxID=3066369 RepID=UPI003307607F